MKNTFVVIIVLIDITMESRTSLIRDRCHVFVKESFSTNLTHLI